MSGRDWNDIVKSVIQDSIEKEDLEAEIFEKEVEGYIRFRTEMSNIELFDLYSEHLSRVYSNVRKMIAKSELVEALRAELRKRLTNAN